MCILPAGRSSRGGLLCRCQGLSLKVSQPLAGSLFDFSQAGAFSLPACTEGNRNADVIQPRSPARSRSSMVTLTAVLGGHDAPPQQLLSVLLPPREQPSFPPRQQPCLQRALQQAPRVFYDQCRRCLCHCGPLCLTPGCRSFAVHSASPQWWPGHHGAQAAWCRAHCGLHQAPPVPRSQQPPSVL